MPSGWTKEESGCYGLMQVVPACGKPMDPGMLPNGHPNLTKDPSSADWAGSIFNPDVNVERGIAGVAGNRAQEVAKFSGCTVDQYTLMAIGDPFPHAAAQDCLQRMLATKLGEDEAPAALEFPVRVRVDPP